MLFGLNSNGTFKIIHTHGATLGLYEYRLYPRRHSGTVVVHITWTSPAWTSPQVHGHHLMCPCNYTY